MSRTRKLLLTAILFLAASGAFVGAHTQFAFAQGDAEGPDAYVVPAPQSSLADALVDRVATSWPWYVTRASGLLAGVLLVLLMVSGTGFITGHTYRFLEPITAWATHRALGIALGVSVLVHIVTLYFDQFVEFDVAAILVPFASDYKPVELWGYSMGSLYVALGILAVYLFLVIIVTSLVWIDSKPRPWKLVHLLSYLGMVFVFVHALYLGTDLAGGVLRVLWVLGGVLVFILTLRRVWRAYTV